ncbi:MAG TPA: hypothetical protein VJS45_06615, partial [Acidimicrobiia bacterium]|nr:hypothetical protein [Acidimicrobiia bacterium]
CSSSDKREDSAGSGAAAGAHKTAGPGNGRVLIILDEAGRLASVDPKTGEKREIPDVFVERGGLAVHSSGLALFQAKGKPGEDGEEGEPDGRLVIVDANGFTATPTVGLKSRGGEYGDGAGDPEELPIMAALREAGGGKRFAMIPTPAGTLLVNLEKRSAVDLTEMLGAPGKFGSPARFSADERWGMISLPEKGLVLFSTDDPAKHTVIDGASLGFSADSRLLFVDNAKEDGPGKVWGVPVEGSSEVVFAEGDIRFRGAVGNSVVIAEPNALYLSNKPGDRRPIDMPYNREENRDTFVGPIGVGSRGFVVSGEREDRRWALVDENTGKVTPLPALGKLDIAQVTDDQVLFGGGFNEEASVPTAFAVLDVAGGKVTPVATWDPAGTQGAFPVPAPHGRAVALSYGRDSEPGAHVKVITPGSATVDLDGAFAGWAPDGSAVLLVRVAGERTSMIVVDLATKKETDLGPGFGAVWTTS